MRKNAKTIDITVLYKKVRIRGTGKLTHVLIPFKPIKGKYDENSKKFIANGKEYNAIQDEFLSLRKDLYYGKVTTCKVSEVDTAMAELFGKNMSYICMKNKGEDARTFDANQIVNAPLTINDDQDPNVYISECMDAAMSLTENDRDLNDAEKTNLIAYYNTFYLFLYEDIDIDGIYLTDIDGTTRDYLYTSMPFLKETLEANNIQIDNNLAQYDASNEKTEEAEEAEETKEIPLPIEATKIKYPNFSFQEVYDGITKVVINQDEQIYKILSMLYKKFVQLEVASDIRCNNAILVTGSTGVGKSEIFKTFASLVDMPIQFMDATQLTAEGYVGAKIEDYLKILIDSCNGDLNKVATALVILDEVDKVRANNTGDKDVNGKAVQEMFLKFLDGTDYRIKDKYDGVKHIINTRHMTNVSMGAFTDLYANLNKNGIGYGSVSINKEATLKHFTNYGMCDEFMGRHSLIIRLNDLNLDSMKRILNESAKSPLIVQRKVFEHMGIDVMFMPGYKQAVAEEAMKRGIGARALNGIVEETTFEPILEIEKNKGKYNRLIFDENTVKDPKQYVLRRD